MLMMYFGHLASELALFSSITSVDDGGDEQTAVLALLGSMSIEMTWSRTVQY
jgi:hypothetical protein